MNKYKVIILSLLISFMGASCEDWLYDNVNEDAAHEVLPQQVLPVVLFYSAQLQFDHAEYGAYLTQTLTTGGRNQTSSFAYKSGWGDFLTMNRHPQWRRHFYDIGVNAKEIIDEAHEAQAWNLELIGRTLRLMSTQMTTDLFGDMPRSEAYESNSPHYDTQESIYEWMNQEIEELIGKGKKQITMDDVAIEDASNYACDDAFVTLELTRYWNEKLDEQSKKLLYDIEVPTSLVLAKMEEQGVALDTEYLAELAKELDTNLKEMEEQIFALAGESFNINSPKQVATVLFEKMGIEHKKKRGAQKFSTDAKVLEELAKEHEIARCLLKYRHYSKMKSTYVDALPDLISPMDGKIHTNYNQTITVTGRLSSSNPNLQNIPVRTKLGSRIRKAFVPEDKNAQVLLSADYSQIELRLLAHCSGDENLIHAFKTGEDIHAQTAAKVFDVPLSEVTKEMRGRAKAVNFGIIYGQTRWGLASALGISNEEAQMFIDKYFLTYPKVKEYMENSIQEAYRHGYAQTMYGRKRYLLDELMSSNRNIKEFAQRAAINTPLQGAASDLIKLAMIDLDKKLEQNNLKSKMIMQVHDELILETCKDELETVQKLVKEAMELNQPLKVPLVVDMEYGSSWMEDEE